MVQCNNLPRPPFQDQLCNPQPPHVTTYVNVSEKCIFFSSHIMLVTHCQFVCQHPAWLWHQVKLYLEGPTRSEEKRLRPSETHLFFRKSHLDTFFLMSICHTFFCDYSQSGKIFFFCAQTHTFKLSIQGQILNPLLALFLFLHWGNINRHLLKCLLVLWAQSDVNLHTHFVIYF